MRSSLWTLCVYVGNLVHFSSILRQLMLTREAMQCAGTLFTNKATDWVVGAGAWGGSLWYVIQPFASSGDHRTG